MKVIIYLVTLCTFLTILLSCRDDSSIVGNKWVESAFTNIYTDSMTVSLSTILLDSMATSGDSIAQIGIYKDELRGELTASFCTEFTVPSFSFPTNAEYAFDSITVTFKLSGSYLGDTLAYPQTLHVHELIQPIDLEKNYLYNISNINYNPVSLATCNFRSYPGEKEEFSVRLPDEMGQEWFNLMRQGSILFSTQEYFKNFFHGLAFIPAENQSCINGFLASSSGFTIQLHYRSLTENVTEQTITFGSSDDYCFNKIVHNRENTPFENLQSNTAHALPSEESGNMAYLQALSGIYVNIEFPYLNEIRRQGNLVTIESAYLCLYPVENSYGDQTPLPKSLTLYTTTDEYVVEDVITDNLGTSVQTASLTVDDTYYKDTYYTFDITSFLQDNLGTSGNSRKKLMLMMGNDDFMTTVDGVFFGDQNHPTNKTVLYVLYKTYNKK